jgi:signal transduction histidine kinase
VNKQRRDAVGSIAIHPSSRLARVGSALFLFGLVVLFPLNHFLLHRFVGAADDMWDGHTLALAQVPGFELMGRLDAYDVTFRRMVQDPGAVCTAVDSLDPGANVFAFAPDGIQRCGPLLPPERLVAGQWVGVDGMIAHSELSPDGWVVGITLDASSLMADGWETVGFRLRLISEGAVIASSTGGDPSVGNTFEPSGRQVLTGLSDNPIAIAVGLPAAHDDDQGWYAIALGYLAAIAVLCGLSLRLFTPLRLWWQKVGAPDDAQMLLIDRNGKIRASSRHRHWGGVGTLFRDRFERSDRTTIDAFLVRSRNGEAGANGVLSVDGGPRVRVVIMGWLFVIRRHIALITRYVADPVVEAVSDEVNRAGSTIVDADGTVLHLGSKNLALFGAHGPSVGENLFDVFEASGHTPLRSLHAASLSRPYLIVPAQMHHRSSRYRCLIVSDEYRRSYMMFDDDTDALHGAVLGTFIAELCAYLQHPGAPRPELARVRGHLLASTADEPITDDPAQDPQRSATERLAGDLQTLVRFADRDRLVASTGSELRLSAARRREFARRLHDDVVQDLVALRWRMGEDVEAQMLHDRVLFSTRAIMSELRVPPWEQRLRDLLELLVQPVKASGISTSVWVQTPHLVPFELISVVGVIAKEALTNAVKHARPEEVTVDLRVVGTHRLLLTVTDDGSGHGDADRGGGFGLPMCIELAEEYGGSFVLSIEEEGHVARLLLPLEVDPDETAYSVPLGSMGSAGKRA